MHSIPTKEAPAQIRDERIQYLAGTPRAMLNKLEGKLLDLDWKQANDNVAVKLLAEDNELYVLAKSKDRRTKERFVVETNRLGAIKSADFDA